MAMLGYEGMPDVSAATLDADGWLHTGDLAVMDDRGYCRIVGRLKDMIVRGGENISPREIEDFLFAQPAVGEVAVVGVPDARLGEQVAAFIRPAAGAEGGVDIDRLRNAVRAHLAHYKAPAYWYVVDELPLNTTGKVQKTVLRDRWIAEHGGG
jgi:acyl-CoA synthetase (AMP-forming)/AMP-acid ligase II